MCVEKLVRWTCCLHATVCSTEHDGASVSSTASRLMRFHTYEDVTDVRVSAKLDSVTFDLTTNDGPLLQAGASGLCLVYSHTPV